MTLKEAAATTNMLIPRPALALLPADFRSSLQAVKEFVYIFCLRFPPFLSLQVNDFLSGKAPLNLTMRLGDHMMLIQLQLSTVNAAANSKRARHSPPAGSTQAASMASGSATSCPRNLHTHSRTTHHVSSNTPPPASLNNNNSPAGATSASPAAPTAATPGTPGGQPDSETPGGYRPKLDTRALTEASKNLTQTLKQLSSEVLTSKCEGVSGN